MEVSDVLLRSDGRRGRWQSSAKNVEEELYRNIISSYEEKQKVLIVENHEMRRSLSNLQMKLNELLHSDTAQDCKLPEAVQINESVSESDFLSTSCSDDTESPPNVKSGHFMMPFSLVQEDILSDILEKLVAVKNYIKRLEACGTEHKDNSDLEKIEEKYKADIERLQKKLERYRCLIEQNQALLGECVQHSREAMHQSSSDIDLTAERNQLMQEKRMFYEQLVAFEEKKRALADVEFHLNKERIALEMTKFRMTPASGAVVGDVHRPLSAQPTPVSTRQKANMKRFLPSTPSAATSKPSGKISSSGERKVTTAERSHSASSGVAYDVSRSLGQSKPLQKFSVQESSPALLCSTRCKPPSSSSHESSPMSYDASMKQVQRLKSADVIGRLQDK